MARHIRSISDVVATQLCTGCGICAYIEPKRFLMGDTLEYGRRPFICDEAALESGEALSVCPGVRLEHSVSMCAQDGLLPEFLDAWGPVLAVWEGYATDPEIRFSGSSGGAVTALALYCIEHEGMSGALHVGARKDSPCLNETVYSTCRSDLLIRAGSRYSPASPCEGLTQIEEADGKSLFIGKPCDVAAVQNSRKIKKNLDKKLGATIAFFCAGVPSIKGTLDLLKANGIDNYAMVKELRYRGKGWPGRWTAKFMNSDGKEEVRQMTYQESWGFLQKYRQWRCYICPDHTGEFADIAVGDPWYRDIHHNEPGKSLIVVRSQRGLKLLKEACDNKYIVLENKANMLLPMSQPNLIKSRGFLWARLLVLRMLLVKVPTYTGFSMFSSWLAKLNFMEKIQSITSTIKRIYKKKLRNQIKITKWP